jgi:hypothetical protein
MGRETFATNLKEETIESLATMCFLEAVKKLLSSDPQLGPNCINGNSAPPGSGH